MPIAQNRLIALISISDALVRAIDTAQEMIGRISINDNIALANSAIDHAQDEGTRQTISHLLQSLTMLHDIATSIEIPMRDRETIIIERTHYKKNEQINTYRRNYMRAIRQQAKDNIISHEQVPQFFAETEPTALDAIATSHVRKHRTMDDIKAESIAKRGKLDDSPPSIARPPEQFPQDAEINTGQNPLGITGKYDKDVISSTVPKTQEEFDADVIEPGVDVL